LIETLRIEGMAVIEHAELEFGPGLNVLTGETGAGKSIVLGALALLAGARASAQGVRDGCDDAVVEAVFDTSRLPDLEASLTERGVETDSHELVVTRSVARTGRSRARLAGQLMPVASLAEMLAGRLEISSQHDSQMLLRPESHARLLDVSAGLLPLRDAVAEGYAEVRAIDSELERLHSDEQERERRRDFLAFQVNEIDSAGLESGAVEALRADRARLAHANRLQTDGEAALAGLCGDSESLQAKPVTDALAAVARSVTGMAELDPSLEGLAERLGALQDELRDVGLDLERYVASVEADPARLAEADERLHQIEGLQRKYGATVEEVLAFRDRAAAELASVEGADERANELVAERKRLCKKLAADAKRLTKGRVRAGRRLADEVLTSLRQLAMPEAQFEVSLVAVDPPGDLPCGPGGAEAPAFAFSANAGEALRPLRAVASGGELSRVFLALKQALRESAAGMVLVFDEVDTGVGGRVADRVGSMLAELAVHHQVLCITHLPQIAAFAQTHFRVAKDASDGRTRTRITRVEGADRVEEIARMAGGESVGAATLAHARELLASRATPPA